MFLSLLIRDCQCNSSQLPSSWFSLGVNFLKVKIYGLKSTKVTRKRFACVRQVGYVLSVREEYKDWKYFCCKKEMIILFSSQSFINGKK